MIRHATPVALVGTIAFIASCGGSALRRTGDAAAETAASAADGPAGDVQVPADDAPMPGADTWPVVDVPVPDVDAVGPDARADGMDTLDGVGDVSVAGVDAAGLDARPAGPDALDGWGPGCHYDCFGYLECKDGVVIQWGNTPVPCEYWAGSCPRAGVGTCQRGCATTRIDQTPLCPMEICLELSPKKPGDPCTAEADCHPTRATVADGGVVQTYLRCETGSHVCVATEAPPLDDWLAPCDPKVVSTATKGAFGALSDPSCSGGRCVYYASNAQACVYQGCTKLCRTDDECPTGAVCQTDSCPTTPSANGYCKPGPINLIGSGLPCR